MRPFLLSLVCVLALEAQTAKPPAPEAPKPEVKPVPKDDQIALLRAQLSMARAQLAIVQTPVYLELQKSQDTYRQMLVNAQNSCGGPVDENALTCTVTPKVEQPKK